MFRSLHVVALVPARGGSKGIPRKNLSVVGNESLVERAVKSGLLSRFVDEVVVSTNDADIARIAVRCGAQVHTRSPHASTDTASACDVLQDFLDEKVDQSIIDSILIVYLQPTSPLRDHHHVDEAFMAMRHHGAEQCVSVVRNEHSPHKAMLVGPDGCLVPLFDERSVTANRQSLPATFRANGAIYIFPLKTFADTHAFPVSGALGYEMGLDDSIDVDTPRDLKIAKRLLEERQEK